ATRKGHQQYSTGIGTVEDQMSDPVSQGVGLSGTRAGDDEEWRTRCGVFLTHTMLDSSSLFAVEAFKISNGHWWPIGQRRSRYSTTILVLFANSLVTQAWALRVSAVPGATHNRIGSNRYRHRWAGAGVGPPGVTPVAVKRDARVSWFSVIGYRGFEPVSLQQRGVRANLKFRGASHRRRRNQARSKLLRQRTRRWHLDEMSFPSPASGCICRVPSITKARSLSYRRTT